jgi:PIN domain nuclease of toxin-antitoxin system
MGASPVTAYLDTHTAVKLAEDGLKRIGPNARAQIAKSTLLLSPMVVLEMQYLFEIKRIMLSAGDLQRKLEVELGVTICNLSFPDVVAVALAETWTREPFDRIIVAHARLNNLAPLISSDRLVHQHYPRAVW